MRLWAKILTLVLAFSIARPVAFAQIAVDDTFRLAQNQFTHGQYDEAIVNLITLLDPIRLDSENDIVEARRILAIAYYLTQERDKAATEFTKLLYLRPTYKLDPFLVAPPIIEFFEQLRKKLKPQLDPIIASKTKEETSNLMNSCDPEALAQKAIRVNYHYNNRALAFAPFGLGQLQNGHRGAGYTSMALQIAAMATNIVTGIIGYRTGAQYSSHLRESSAGQVPYDADYLNGLARRNKAMVITNIISGSAFVIVWGSSVIHANYHYEPYKMELSNEPVDPNWLKKELAP